MFVNHGERLDAATIWATRIGREAISFVSGTELRFVVRAAKKPATRRDTF
jgi:hypothetical protein